MSIGEFSQRSGLSPKRLRSYAAMGLLTPTAVDPDTGYRYYSPGQLADARLIDTLRSAGMPLAEIGPVVRQQSVRQLDAWACHVRADADRKQRYLAAARELLRGDAMRCTTEGRAIVRLQAVGRTETGYVRENNEDTILTGERLVAVADGMGGHAAGEVASALAAALVGATFTGRSVDEMEAAVRAANWVLWERASADEALAGMGTTICAGGLLDDGRVVIANVGDSRAYLIRDGSLRRLTTDHTLTADLVLRGEMTEAEAAVHDHRHVLTRALGIGPTAQVDVAAHQVDSGDVLMLCSDGLFNDVPDQEISAVVTSGPTPEEAVDALVGRALSNGGRDNVSVVMAHVILAP